jgi:Flp pilus assembly protein TadG
MTPVLIRSERGSAAVEFALVAPTFLMFLFLILDGGRMVFTRQALNEVATATARCAAIKATGCTTKANAEGWAVSRGSARDNVRVATATVEIGTSCNNVANMARATVTTNWKKGSMTLLPQSIAPATLTSSACFPMAG